MHSFEMACAETCLKNVKFVARLLYEIQYNMVLMKMVLKLSYLKCMDG